MERERYIPEQMQLPKPLPVEFEHVPQTLQAYNQWVVWKYAVVEGEIKKPPFNPTTGKQASVSNARTWGSFHDAHAAYTTGKFAGVGIVLTDAMGIVGIDIDHCVYEGKVDEEAHHIISMLDSYTEISPSGTGIRIMLAGTLPGALRRKGNVEVYDTLRYLTLTGHALANTPQDIQPRQAAIEQVYQHIFSPVKSQQGKENTGWGDREQRQPSYPISLSDEAVLSKALQAKNGHNFRRYFSGDASLWEGAGARHRSQSEADFTLVLMLLYWTNHDTTQVDRLFRQSGLMREKWTKPLKGSETYGDRVIADAIRKGNH